MFHTKEINYLGFIVSTCSIIIELDCVTAVRDWPLPESIHDIQVFLGFVNFYCRFIYQFAKIMAPLLDYTKGLNKKDFQKLKLLIEVQEAFIKLKYIFEAVPVLVYFNLEYKLYLKTDISGKAVTAILF